MAVVDLLDELREHIWARYALQLHEAYREHYQPQPSAATPQLSSSDDEPF